MLKITMVFVDIFIIGISITRISFLSYLISAANEREMNFIVTPQIPAGSCHSLQDKLSSAKSQEDMSRGFYGAVSGWEDEFWGGEESGKERNRSEFREVSGPLPSAKTMAKV
jgi:hypothetical protein